jgi:hypothetical protein
MLCHPCSPWRFPAIPLEGRLAPCVELCKPVKERAVIRHTRAHCIAYIEPDIGKVVGVRRPLSGAWDGRNLDEEHSLHFKEITNLANRQPFAAPWANLPRRDKVLMLKDERRPRWDALERGNSYPSPWERGRSRSNGQEDCQQPTFSLYIFRGADA